MTELECDQLQFLQQGGEMGRRIRATDWSQTACGPIENWPQSLRTAVSILLRSGYPMYLAWGDQFVQFYNDAYSPILAEKHPDALGRTTPETWSEIWPEIGPMFNGVRNSGEAVTVKNHCFIMQRRGYPEECYFDFSYSPIDGERDEPDGIFVTCAETTQTVLYSRRTHMVHRLSSSIHGCNTVTDVYRTGFDCLAEDPYELPFGLVYLVDAHGDKAELFAHFGLGEHSPLLKTLDLQGDSSWPIGSAIRAGRPVVGWLSCPGHLGPTVGPWPERPQQIVVVPVFGAQSRIPEAIFVFGINARRPFEADYQAFFESVATQFEQAILRLRVQEQALGGAERRYRAVFDKSSDGLLVTTPAGEVREANRAAGSLLGVDPTELSGAMLTDFVDPQRSPELPTLLTDSGEGGGYTQINLYQRNGAGPLTEVSVETIEYEGDQQRLVSLRDLSERERYHAEAAYQATHDSLTNLINRFEFERRLDAALDRANDQSAGMHVAYLDLDEFKVVNDTCGHTAGDELLRQLAEVMLVSLEERHTLARLGGDEFGVLLIDVTAVQAGTIMQHMLEYIRGFRFLWQGRTYSVMASAGLAEIPCGNVDRTELISRVDSACYAAKTEGRDRVKIVGSDDINGVDPYRAEMEWVAEIVAAVDHDRLCLDRQLIVPIGSPDKRSFYELLVRMTDTNGQLVSPGQFIPPAERFNLMSTIDRWVIRRACCRLASDSDTSVVYTINVSGNTLGTTDFASFVRRQIESNEVDPGRLCFELTETAAVQNLQRSQHFINEIRGLGCSIALDDFGSGFCSYAYLENLPCDYIKIDGSFVRRIATDAMAYAIVESITDISHKAGLLVVAEQVEDEDSLSLLRDLGVDYAQGFGIALGERWL